MANVLGWDGDRAMWMRVLEKQTGQGLEYWNQLVRKENFADEKSLRAWLKEQGVTGYAESLLVWEQFGYPAFLIASAQELIEGQYADRLHLRPVCDAILAAALEMGEAPFRRARLMFRSSHHAERLRACSPRRGPASIWDCDLKDRSRSVACDLPRFTKQ